MIKIHSWGSVSSKFRFLYWNRGPGRVVPSNFRWKWLGDPPNQYWKILDPPSGNLLNMHIRGFLGALKIGKNRAGPFFSFFLVIILKKVTQKKSWSFFKGSNFDVSCRIESKIHVVVAKKCEENSSIYWGMHFFSKFHVELNWKFKCGWVIFQFFVCRWFSMAPQFRCEGHFIKKTVTKSLVF